jgi:DNA modification methylase
MSTGAHVERIGNAELWLGDAQTVLPELADHSVDFIFTDPPYGHNNNNGDLIHRREKALGQPSHSEARPIANDDGPAANILIRWAFAQFNRLLPGGGCCCCCCGGGGGGPDPQFARWSLWLDEAVGLKQMVVWDKGPIGMGWHYRRSYETVLVGEKRGAACRWYDQTNSVENIIRPGFFGIRKILPAADEHPTPKPWRLAAHFMQLHTLPGHLVLDPFMGHGSTGEACAYEGRRFIGVEIDPQHFEAACLRIETAQRQGNLFNDYMPPAEDPADARMADLFERRDAEAAGQ